MKRRYLTILILGAIILSAVSCDLEKYVGYNYDAESLIETTKISGKVTNVFTGLPVNKSLIRVGGNETYSDSEGSYLMVYPLGPDEERDKVVTMTVTAEKYFPDSLEIIVYPEGNEYDFSLVYGAPIIESSTLSVSFSNNAICRATVFDYQGVEDINSVMGVFVYAIPKVSVTKDTVVMQQISVLNENSALYEVSIPLSYVNLGGLILSAHEIIAYDKSDFFGSKTFLNVE